MIALVAQLIDRLAEGIASSTKKFVNTKMGNLFLGLSIVGPFTFIPTVWQAWTAADIDSFRTITWPLMALVNFSVFISVCHNGEWRLRLTMFLWVILMFLIWMATLVR
jgi:hypothetical protein